VKSKRWILKPPGFHLAKKSAGRISRSRRAAGAWEDGGAFEVCFRKLGSPMNVGVLPNTRGSTGFGQKSSNEISGDGGGKCYRDLMAGADYVENCLTSIRTGSERPARSLRATDGYMMDGSPSARPIQWPHLALLVYNFESMWGTTERTWLDAYEHGGSRLPWEDSRQIRESPHTKPGTAGEVKDYELLIQNDLDFDCPAARATNCFRR